MSTRPSSSSTARLGHRYGTQVGVMEGGLPEEYYRDYDLLHSEKEYGDEAATVLRFASRLGIANAESVIDVGCGTGSHAKAFHELGLAVTAIDVDPRMAGLARAKLEGLPAPVPVVMNGRVEQAQIGRADLAVALFNVVNYVHSSEDLSGLFQGVADRLNKPGVFVFDCWNGAAVRADPPRSFTRVTGPEGGRQLSVKSRGWLGEDGESATVEYAVTEPGFPSGKSYSYTLRSKLWDLDEITNLLAGAGFSGVEICRWMEPGISASPTDWKVMIGARTG